jgi:ABC-type oligopeptide transport system substrate-binding subunit
MPRIRRLLGLLAAATLAAAFPGCGSKKKTEWPTPAAGPAVEEARRLLTEAGFPFGNGFPEIELLYNTNEAHKRIAAAVQEMWRKNLGVEIRLRNTEWKVYMEQLTRVDYQVARRGWVADYPDPNTFIDMFLSKSGNNNTGWANPAYDALVDQAARTKDPRARLEVLQRAERLLMDELPIAPIYFYVTQEMWRPSLHGFYENPMEIHPLKEIAHEDGSKIFVMNVGAEPQTLDPNRQRGVPEHRVNLALFEGLTVYHPKTLEPQPGAAERWTASEDLKTWTFTLREAKWTNGRAVTAGDFVYGWRRQIDPAVAADYAYIVFTYVKNAKAYYDGASADGALQGFAALDDEKRLAAAKDLPEQAQARHADPLRKAAEAEKKADIKALLEKALAAAASRKDVTVEDVGVRAADDRTLVVELEAPTPFFLYLTAFPGYNPIPREAVEKHGDKWTRPEHIVTNGPFVMKEWVPNSHILVERSPTYWDAAKVRQRQIKFLTVDNVNTAFNMFKSGQCDWIETVPLEFVDALKSDPNFHCVPYLTTYYYSFNVTRKPLDDKRVRRALALAIDRETICGKILRAGQKPAYSIVPPGLAGYASQPFYESPAAGSK